MLESVRIEYMGNMAHKIILLRKSSLKIGKSFCILSLGSLLICISYLISRYIHTFYWYLQWNSRNVNTFGVFSYLHSNVQFSYNIRVVYVRKDKIEVYSSAWESKGCACVYKASICLSTSTTLHCLRKNIFQTSLI